MGYIRPLPTTDSKRILTTCNRTCLAVKSQVQLPHIHHRSILGSIELLPQMAQAVHFCRRLCHREDDDTSDLTANTEQ